MLSNCPWRLVLRKPQISLGKHAKCRVSPFSPLIVTFLRLKNGVPSNIRSLGFFKVAPRFCRARNKACRACKFPLFSSFWRPQGRFLSLVCPVWHVFWAKFQRHRANSDFAYKHCPHRRTDRPARPGHACFSRSTRCPWTSTTPSTSCFSPTTG